MKHSSPNTPHLSLALVMLSLLQISLLQSAQTQDHLQASIFDSIHNFIFGSSSSATSKPVVKHPAAPAASSASSVAPEPIIANAPVVREEVIDQTVGFHFRRTLRTGMKGNDVMNLQLILNSDLRTQMADTGDDSPGHETGIYDYKTRIGLIAFQKLNLITPAQLIRLRREQGFAGLTTRVALESFAKTLITAGKLSETGATFHGAAGDNFTTDITQSDSASSSRLVSREELARLRAERLARELGLPVVPYNPSSSESYSSVQQTAQTSSTQSTATSVATSSAQSAVSTVSSVASSIASAASVASSVSADPSAFPVHAPIVCPQPGTPLHAFYVDPVNGSKMGDGSQAKPWRTLQEVIEMNLINGQDPTKGKVHAGDIIYLMTGDHGAPYPKNNLDNTDFITIAAAPGQTPVLHSLTMYGGSKWVFKGLSFVGSGIRLTPVNNAFVLNNTMVSQADVSSWTPADWAQHAARGVIYGGTCGTIRNNIIRNMLRGIDVGGTNIEVTDNVVDNYADDGIDLNGHNILIRRNVVTNHYGKLADGNHNDGISDGYSPETLQTNIIIDSNIVIQSTGIYPSVPLLPGLDDVAYALQGISLFDGEWQDITATNNVVAVSNYHGLSFYGLKNGLIANNTVVRQSSDPDPKHSPWLAVLSSKNGVAPTNVIVRNNIANNFLVPLNFQDHNVSFTTIKDWNKQPGSVSGVDPSSIFINIDLSKGPFDLQLKSGSPAIGTGIATNAPTTDVTGKARNPANIDAGAYAK